MKILNFGSCNVDYVYSIDHIVREGETETTGKLETFPGGKGLNQSVAAARAGANIYHAGCIGSGSEMLTDILSKNGIDITYLKKVDEKTGHAIIQVSNEGENAIFLYPGSNEMITKEYIDYVLGNFEKGDIILLQNEISNVDYIVEKAYERQMCIIFNPSPYNEKIDKIDFNKIEYVLLNETEVMSVSGCDNYEEGLAYMSKHYPSLKIVLTLGSRGCIYKDGEFEVYQSAYKVKAVDTTAAGDTFTGYFVAELSRGTDCKDILQIATAASAIAVSREGAAPSIPEKSEVTASIGKLEESKTNGNTDKIQKKIKDYIDNNLKTASLDELSKLMGYSASYTGNLVKRITGKSFLKAVQEQRCKEAAKKLLNTDLSVGEIIKDLGYENESFFRKIFKEVYGLNPSEYRKRSRR